MRIWNGLLAVLCVFIGTAARGQNAPAPAHASTPAGNVGLFVYPKNGQGPGKQLDDEGACYDSAKTQSGVDPTNLPPPTVEAEKKKGGGVKGAAGGAAGGAAIGAIAGNAGQGAAIGAVVGTVSGRRQQRKTNKQAEKEATAAGAGQQAAALDGFKRAMSACLDARGYSVK
jgi:hypothetical protein